MAVDKFCSDESVPAPSSRADDNQDAELAEVIEKSKTEVSGPNGESAAPDSEMTDTPAAHEGAKPESADAEPAKTASGETEEKSAEDKSGELAEPPVEVHGGNDAPSVENGAPEKSEASDKALKVEANDVAASEIKEQEPKTKATNGDTAVEEHAPDHDTPSSILEKGTRDAL